MKMKTRAKIVTSIIALVLSCVLLFTVMVVNNNTNQVVGAATRTVELSASTIDAQSILNEFDDAKLTKKGTTTYFEGYKAIDKDKLSEIDYISEDDFAVLEECTVKYNFSYDSETNIVTLAACATLPDGNIKVEELYGVAFTNENGEIDAVINLDGDYVLLSEMRAAGMIENCGWFSNLFKKVAIAVAAVVVVAAVAATIAFTCGAGLGAVIAVGAIAGGITGGIAGGAISYTETGEVKLEYVVIGIAAGAAIGAAVGAAVYNIGTAIKTSKLISKDIDMQKIGEHVFSREHKADGIMKLGKSEEDILNKFFDIAIKNSDKWVEGSNEIRTIINGCETTIRFFVKNGQIIHLNGFVGFPSRIIGFLISLL